jgi:hypothetical protein
MPVRVDGCCLFEKSFDCHWPTTETEAERAEKTLRPKDPNTLPFSYANARWASRLPFLVLLPCVSYSYFILYRVTGHTREHVSIVKAEQHYRGEQDVGPLT